MLFKSFFFSSYYRLLEQSIESCRISFSPLNNHQQNKKKKKFLLLFFLLPFVRVFDSIRAIDKQRKKSAACTSEAILIRTSRSYIMNKVIECVPNFSEGQRKEVMNGVCGFFCSFDSMDFARLLIPLRMQLPESKVWHYWISIQVYRRIERFIVRSSYRRFLRNFNLDFF